MTRRQRGRFERRVSRLRRAMRWLVSRNRNAVGSIDVGFPISQAMMIAASDRYDER